MAAISNERLFPILSSFGDLVTPEPGETTYVSRYPELTDNTLYARSAADSETTNEKGNETTPAAISETRRQFAEEWSAPKNFLSSEYDWEHLTQAGKQSLLMAYFTQAGKHLGKRRDNLVVSNTKPSDLPSANVLNGGAVGDITLDLIYEGLELAMSLNQDGPYYWLFPTQQFSILANKDFGLTKYSDSGMPGLLSSDMTFKVGNLTIVTHNRAYTDGSTFRSSILIGPGALRAVKMSETSREWQTEGGRNLFAGADAKIKAVLAQDRVVTMKHPMS